MIYLRHTVKESGGDFTSLAACVAHIASVHPNWVAEDYGLDIIIDGSWSAVETANIDLSDLGDNDADHPILVRAIGSARHIGKWTSTAYVLDGNLSILNGHIKVIGLQVDGAITIYPGDHPTNMTVCACLNKNGGIDATTEGISHHFGEQYLYLYNNIVYDCTTAFYMTNWLFPMFVFNNTAYNCDYGFRVYPGAPISGDNVIALFNNVTRDCTDGYYDAGGDGFRADSDYNSSDVSADAKCAVKVNTVSPWYSGATTDADIFVDAANDDFHLKSGCIFLGVGVNLGQPVSEDVDGQIRPSVYDLGADQYVDVAGALPWWW